MAVQAVRDEDSMHVYGYKQERVSCGQRNRVFSLGFMYHTPNLHSMCELAAKRK
jgi:hypothetical protein